MSELFPAKTIAIEVFRCNDSSRIAVMNRWYDRVFVPAMRRISGVEGVYRYIARDFDYGEHTPEMFLLIPNINYEKDLPELDDWWLYTHAHDILEIPGYIQASRYHNITPSVTDGDPRALNIYEIDSDDPLHHPLLENIIGDEGRMKEGRLLDVKNPAARETCLCGTFQHWDLMAGI